VSGEEHLGEDLAAYVGLAEPLAPERFDRHTRHLETCAECRLAVRETQELSLALDATPLAPSADFDRKLFERLDAIDASARIESRREWWQSLLRPSRIALALGPVAAGLLWFLASRPRATDEPLPADSSSALAALDDLELGANLELYGDLDAAEYLDVAEDLDLLLAEEGEAG
jgi:anti-sigma factor RsiW